MTTTTTRKPRTCPRCGERLTRRRWNTRPFAFVVYSCDDGCGRTAEQFAVASTNVDHRVVPLSSVPAEYRREAERLGIRG